MTEEAFPRLSVVTGIPCPEGALGPFASRSAAQLVVDAIHDAVRIRRCSQRLSRHPRLTPCALAELGRCGAPCA
ncbi:hypothetical protein, partial [Staphylococcus aureus]|uniref:hypothetical protein n=1 Tax=Staphylococcus aureus TaxID=1280 RepID=UPI003D11AC66